MFRLLKGIAGRVKAMFMLVNILYRRMKAIIRLVRTIDKKGGNFSFPNLPERYSYIEEPTQEPALSLRLQQSWSYALHDALCLGSLVLRNSGRPHILVADKKKQLHFLHIKGYLTKVVSLPTNVHYLETSQHATHGTCLLGKAERSVYVMDDAGHILWRYTPWLWIDTAHWGDINRDGHDEVILGNWLGDLFLLDCKGKRLGKLKNIRRTWDHAIIPLYEEKKTLILATDAAGSLTFYDQTGMLLQRLEQDYWYFSTVDVILPTASSHECQIGALGSHGNTPCMWAFDSSGSLLWKTRVCSRIECLMNRSITHGDMNGDGLEEWALMKTPDDLVVMSQQGKQLATLSGQQGIEDILIVPTSDSYGLLLTLHPRKITAYRFGSQALEFEKSDEKEKSLNLP